MESHESNDQNQTSEWQQSVINKLAFAAVNEQKRARRWGIFFKTLMFVYLAAILYLYTPDVDVTAAATGKHTALVELTGVIAADKEANADDVVTGLRDAFENKHTAGVILRINSPGGSPVQAGYINDEAAADKIYADKASIVGSIGVRMDGFGFVDAIEKLGVERRLLTAGEHKGFLDPFQPAQQADIDQVQKLLDDIHQQFIDVVTAGRGDKLKQDPDLFSGYVWTGEQAVTLGLVDELGSSGYVAREVIGEETIVDYTQTEDWLTKFGKRFGTALGRGVGEVLGGNFTLK
jgi:protease-4